MQNFPTRSSILDEGYIKFQAYWKETPALDSPVIPKLMHWRDVLYQHQLIGAYSNGIGYGNISHRYDSDKCFVISGSATGNVVRLGVEHFALVTDFDLEKNTSLYLKGFERIIALRYC